MIIFHSSPFVRHRRDVTLERNRSKAGKHLGDEGLRYKVKKKLRVLVEYVIDFGFKQIVRYGLRLEELFVGLEINVQNRLKRYKARLNWSVLNGSSLFKPIYT